jgi:hypothetical protein
LLFVNQRHLIFFAKYTLIVPHSRPIGNNVLHLHELFIQPFFCRRVFLKVLNNGRINRQQSGVRILIRHTE